MGSFSKARFERERDYMSIAEISEQKNTSNEDPAKRTNSVLI